jgi:hypothetical protein
MVHTKVCKTCGIEKPITEFYLINAKNTKEHPPGSRVSYCRKCKPKDKNKKEHQKRYYEKVMALKLKRILEEPRICIRCGKKYYVKQLRQHNTKYCEGCRNIIKRKKISKEQAAIYNERKKIKYHNNNEYRKKYIAKVIENQDKARINLSDNYIKKLICKRYTTILSHKDVPVELIEIWREKIKLHRILKPKILKGEKRVKHQ